MTERAGLVGRQVGASEVEERHIGSQGPSHSRRHCAFVIREESKELEEVVLGQVPAGVLVMVELAPAWPVGFWTPIERRTLQEVGIGWRSVAGD